MSRTLEPALDQTPDRTMAPQEAHAEGQQHPVRIYLMIWGLLFILSTFS